MTEPEQAKIHDLVKRIEGAYRFEELGGYLENCAEWVELKSIILKTHTHKALYADGRQLTRECSSCGKDLFHEVHERATL